MANEAAKQQKTASYPVIVNSRVIGSFAGQPMHAWDEIFDGAVRSFEDYVTSFYSPAFDRPIGLTLVRERRASIARALSTPA